MAAGLLVELQKIFLKKDYCSCNYPNPVMCPVKIKHWISSREKLCDSTIVLLLCLINNHLLGLLLGFGAKMSNRNMWRDLKLIAIGFFFQTITTWQLYRADIFSHCVLTGKGNASCTSVNVATVFLVLDWNIFFSCINVNELVRQMLTCETWDVYTEICSC